MDVLLHLCLSICLFPTYLTEYQVVHVTTAPYYSYQPLLPYGIHIRGREWITFQVKTLHDAMIGLQTYYNYSTDDMYEVDIGGWSNTKSVIRERALWAHEVETNGIELSNVEYRHFWVSWTGGNITLGRGSDIGSDVIVSWTDPNPRVVKYLAVSSWPQATGEWIFDIQTCKEQLKFAVLQKNAMYTPTDARMITDDDVAPSPDYCAYSCYSKPWCRGFSYGSTDHQCIMFDVAPLLEDLDDVDEWETWYLIQ